MLKFIRGKGQQPNSERLKLQKELYAFRKTVQHGFPHKPTSLAYDPKQRLMAIATQSGVIKVFGQPGVEFYGQHTTSDYTVQLLEWVKGSGCILSLTTGNVLTLWEPAGSLLVPVQNITLEGKLQKTSSLCCSFSNNTVWIGTEGGFVYQFDLKSFKLKDAIVSHDIISGQLPSTFHHNPGAVECVKQVPTNHNYLLIAYNRGLCVLWDTVDEKVVRSYISPGHGQSVGLYVEQDSEKFTWYHADGSYATWYIDSSDPPEDEKYVPYGPDPCKAIDRLVRGYRDDDEIVIFSGGMPRSAYGDHQCVSVHCKDGTKVALDFTSKVIDFFVTFDKDETDDAQVLVVLLEEELVAFDLTDKKLPQVVQPYLHSLHASAITCNYLVSRVSEQVFIKLKDAGAHQIEGYSNIEWPVDGGNLVEKYLDESVEQSDSYDVLITGHEDGSVKFWDCSKINVTPIVQIKTAPIFGHEDDLVDNQQSSQDECEEGEPPFRKAGHFDPYSDDPRFAVKKVALCAQTGIVVVAGTAGNLVVFDFNESPEKVPLQTTTVNLVSDRDGFVWKGHDQLKCKVQLLQEYTNIQAGVEVKGVFQILPPAAITCVALQSMWGLLAAGTAHGLVLFDFKNHRPVLHKCTLNPNDMTGAGEALSRKKSFKKTLRESFRRLRKGRSTRNQTQNNTQQAETRPMERQIEARPVDDSMGSMVRCLTFAHTFITNAHTPIASLWSGTNASCVSIFVIYLPPKPSSEDSTDKKPITGQLAKEIQLKHRAPIIAISLYDSSITPLDFHQPSSTLKGPHKVLIVSEEQFKIFSLPNLKPVTKYKLTAHEGARVRKIQFAMFSYKLGPTALNIVSDRSLLGTASPPPTRVASAIDNQNNEEIIRDLAANTEYHYEIGLLCLTNLGECLVLSVPELKRQIIAAAIRREDINGISSLCFTALGEAFFMMSSSEMQRITLSANKILTATGNIEVEFDTNANIEQIEDENNDNTSTINNSDQDVKTSTDALSNPNGNDTVLSGDISVMTIDSVKDHLNSTVSTICSQTTEEIIGRLSVLNTNTVNQLTVANSKDIIDLNMSNIKDLKEFGDTIETNSSSIVIKSVIASTINSNGESETYQKTTTARESQL